MNISLSTFLTKKNTKLKSVLRNSSLLVSQIVAINFSILIVECKNKIHKNTRNNFKINEINESTNLVKSKYNNHRSRKFSKFSLCPSMPRKNKSKNDRGNVETWRKRSSPKKLEAHFLAVRCKVKGA